jgi:putative NADPH-quinone reductase
MTEDGWKGDVKDRVALLRNKKALIVSTTYFSEENYRQTDLQDAMEKIVGEYGLQYPGIKNVQHVYFYNVYFVDDGLRKKYLDTAFQLGKEF